MYSIAFGTVYFSSTAGRIFRSRGIIGLADLTRPDDEASRPDGSTPAATSAGTKSVFFISQVFSFEDLGFEEMDEDIFRVYFRDIELGELDVAELRFGSVRAMP
jgi:hypothetical protein